MIQLVVAGLMWGLVACLLTGLKRRKDHSILVAAIAIAAALTLNVDAVYAVADPIFGARNLVDLCSAILMVIGIYFLSRAIIRAAAAGESSQKLDIKGLVILALVIVALIVTFSLIAAPRTSTSFMKDYGDQWAAAAYSGVQFLYIGAVVSVTGYICFRFRGGMARKYFRVALIFIGIGCSLVVVLVLSVIGMDILHLQGRLEEMAQLSYVFDASLVAAMAFLCIGLALPPVARWVEHRAGSRLSARLVNEVTEIWVKVTAESSNVRLNTVRLPKAAPDDSDGRLHRMVVEIQDALFVDPELARLLTEHDVELLSRAEQHLVGQNSARDPG